MLGSGTHTTKKTVLFVKIHFPSTWTKSKAVSKDSWGAARGQAPESHTVIVFDQVQYFRNVGKAKSGLSLETTCLEGGMCKKNYTSGPVLFLLNIKTSLTVWFQISVLLQALKAAPCCSNKWKQVKYNGSIIVFVVFISHCLASLVIVAETQSHYKKRH